MKPSIVSLIPACCTVNAKHLSCCTHFTVITIFAGREMTAEQPADTDPLEVNTALEALCLSRNTCTRKLLDSMVICATVVSCKPPRSCGSTTEKKHSTGELIEWIRRALILLQKFDLVLIWFIASHSIQYKEDVTNKFEINTT